MKRRGPAKGRADMRKALVMFIILLLGVAASGVVGCGGNTGQAKTYMKEADAAYDKLKKEMDALQGTLTGVLGGAVMGNYGMLTPQMLDEAAASIKEALSKMPAVKADYEKLAGLSGVPEYSGYANAMIRAIEASTEALERGQKVIEQLKPLLASGDTAAIKGVLNAEEINELQKLQEVAVRAYADAQAVKTGKNLGE